MIGETEQKTPVYLRVYDISNGKVATWSQFVLRRKIEGIWHTAIHVFGFEYFYGGGINCMTSSQVESSFDMEIVETRLLGYTTKSRSIFEEYFLQLYHKFTPDTYDLVKWNCNHFSDTCAKFLLGHGIPNEILNLPQIVGSTFIGNVALKVFQRVTQGNNPTVFDPDDPNHPRHEFSPEKLKSSDPLKSKRIGANNKKEIAKSDADRETPSIKESTSFENLPPEQLSGECNSKDENVDPSSNNPTDEVSKDDKNLRPKPLDSSSEPESTANGSLSPTPLKLSNDLSINIDEARLCIPNSNDQVSNASPRQAGFRKSTFRDRRPSIDLGPQCKAYADRQINSNNIQNQNKNDPPLTAQYLSIRQSIGLVDRSNNLSANKDVPAPPNSVRRKSIHVPTTIKFNHRNSVLAALADSSITSSTEMAKHSANSANNTLNQRRPSLRLDHNVNIPRCSTQSPQKSMQSQTPGQLNSNAQAGGGQQKLNLLSHSASPFRGRIATSQYLLLSPRYNSSVNFHNPLSSDSKQLDRRQSITIKPHPNQLPQLENLPPVSHHRRSSVNQSKSFAEDDQRSKQMTENKLPKNLAGFRSSDFYSSPSPTISAAPSEDKIHVKNVQPQSQGKALTDQSNDSANVKSDNLSNYCSLSQAANLSLGSENLSYALSSNKPNSAHPSSNQNSRPAVQPTAEMSSMKKIAQSPATDSTCSSEAKHNMMFLASALSSSRWSKQKFIPCPDCGTKSPTADMMCRKCGYDFMFLEPYTCIGV